MNKQTEQRIQTTFAVIALVCLLSYTFVHTGSLLARYIWSPIGWIGAFGIELTVAFLSYRLATLKRNYRTSKMLLALLAFALLVSVFANVFEGYAVKFGQELTWGRIWQIDALQAIIGLSATGLLSVMVFAVSEIVGSDVSVVVKQAEREQRKAKQDEQPDEQPMFAPQPGASYQDTIYSILEQSKQEGKQISQAQIVSQTGISKATVSKWANAWESERTNGSQRSGQ